MLEVQNSIALFKPPIVSPNEFSFSIPASRTLWRARSSTEWQALYMARWPQTPARIVTVSETMQNLANLEIFKDDVDAAMCALVVLHGYWIRIWYYHDSQKFAAMGFQKWPADAPQTWHFQQQQDLYKSLDGFRIRLYKLAGKFPEICLFNHLLMMSLFVRMEDLLKFAGKSGREEAKQSLGRLHDWMKTGDSRYAVWHAGQVFCAAERFPPSQVVGIYAVAIYHAALTLWVYGSLAESQLPEGSTTLGPDGVQVESHAARAEVALNAADSQEAYNFLHLGHGQPGLMASRGNDQLPAFVALSHTDLVMTIACDIYHNNFSSTTELPPYLVENLTNLLRDLGKLTFSRLI